MNWEDRMMALAVEEAKKRPNEPTAGLGYMFALAMKRRLDEHQQLHGKIFWVTINPSDTLVSFQAFKLAIESLVKRNIFSNTAYAFEQRGKSEEEMGKGFHCHLLFDKPAGLSPAQVQDRIFSSMKKFCGNKRCVDVRVYPYSYKQEKLDYLRGDKWDSDKEESVRINRIFRRTNNLLDLYEITA